MAFERPTLGQLKTRVLNDLKGSLNITTLLRRSFVYVFGIALAGVAHTLHGFFEFLEQQAFPDTATGEYIKRWANIYRVSPHDATFAKYIATSNGEEGTVIPAGTVFLFEGLEYTTDSEVVVTGPAGTNTPITAVQAGTNSNLNLGDILTIESPIAGLDSSITLLVGRGFNPGEDAETLVSLKERYLDKIRNAPSGGAANDYVQWAKEIPGVTRAWVLPGILGPASVGVSFVRDGDENIFPDPEHISEVRTYINAPDRIPLLARLDVFPPTRLEVDLSISLRPNTPTIQEAITNSLKDLILRDSTLEGSYKNALELNSGRILLSKFNEAISTSPGVEDHLITSVQGETPANVQPELYELPVLGAVTWDDLQV